jgi:hypothetical protein
MKRLLAGLASGLILGTGGAIAATEAIRIPPGASANVAVAPRGSQTTLLRFGAIDFRCEYYRTNAPPPETGIEPLLFCRRSSNPKSYGVVITPYRIYVNNSRGGLVFRTTRTP